MSKHHEIHKIQATILRTLLFKPSARFAELNTDGISTDQFAFHVKKLQTDNLIIKTEDGGYSLTGEGKEFANRFDTEKIALERQAKLGILVIPINIVDGTTLYLTQTRLKQPFYGFRGFITGKISWGEEIFQTASRELEEEAGLSASLELAGIEHKMDYDKETNQILEDKFFYVVRATKVKGVLITDFEGGRNTWLTQDEILSDKSVFQDVSLLLNKIAEPTLFFHEQKFYYSKKQY